MKAMFKFNLPEENEEYKQYMQAPNMHLALWEFSQFLRSKLKYEELTDEEHRIYEEIRQKFYECLEEESVDLF